MAKTKNKMRDDAVEILHRRLISGNQDRMPNLRKFALTMLWQEKSTVFHEIVILHDFYIISS